MSETLCTCGKPTAGAWLCTQCAHTLAYAVANIAAYMDDLELVAERRTRYSVGSGSKSIGKTQPLVVDMRFAGADAKGTKLRTEVRTAIVGWCRVLIEDSTSHHGPTCQGCDHLSCKSVRRTRLPSDTVRSMCHYLDRQHQIIEWSEWAPAMLDDLLRYERRLRAMVDRPAETWFAGTCSCGERLQATPGRPTVVCRACGQDYDVAKCRAALLREAAEYLVTASEAAWALVAWTEYAGSETKLIDLIRKWRDREHVETRGSALVSGRERDLYRLGDLQDLTVRHAQREQERNLARRKTS